MIPPFGPVAFVLDTPGPGLWTPPRTPRPWLLSASPSLLTPPSPRPPSPLRHLPGHHHPASGAGSARGHRGGAATHGGAISGSAGHQKAEGRSAPEPGEPRGRPAAGPGAGAGHRGFRAAAGALGGARVSAVWSHGFAGRGAVWDDGQTRTRLAGSVSQRGQCPEACRAQGQVASDPVSAMGDAGPSSWPHCWEAA